MRVVMAHNFYSSAQPSGENQTVRQVLEAVRGQGVEAVLYAPSSDMLNTLRPAGRLEVASRPVWPLKRSEFLRKVVEFQPDLVQVHNVYPFIPPRDLKVIRSAGIPVVHVVHNYRHTCISGNHYRNGSPCHDCGPGRLSNLPGIVHGCYRGSRPQSAVLALSNSLHHNAWRDLHYSCISEHVRRYLVESGFPESRMRVIPNPVGSAVDSGASSAGHDVLFASRLEREKGLGLLLEAWRGLAPAVKDGATLHIAGAGSEESVAAAAARERSDVRFHGLLGSEELEVLGKRCKLSVVPSLWEEPFGRGVIEAYRAGRGVVVSDQGGLPELVREGETGWVGGSDVRTMQSALTSALSADPSRLSRAAEAYWRGSFTREAVGRRYKEWWSEVLEDFAV
jgi:glycosyltransferase involved in cell wall biosynthesis